MAYTVFGKVIDGEKNAVPFALVFTSDANGKPLNPSKNTQTDDNGKWKLDGLTDSDYVTIRMVGLKPQTFLAKSAVSVPIIGMAGLSQKFISTTLTPDATAMLHEVEVVSPKYIPPPSKPNYAKYALIGGLLILIVGVTVYYTSKNKFVKA